MSNQAWFTYMRRDSHPLSDEFLFWDLMNVGHVDPVLDSEKITAYGIKQLLCCYRTTENNLSNLINVELVFCYNNDTIGTIEIGSIASTDNYGLFDPVYVYFPSFYFRFVNTDTLNNGEFYFYVRGI